MSLMGIVGLKEGFIENAFITNHTPHLQVQFMLKDTDY